MKENLILTRKQRKAESKLYEKFYRMDGQTSTTKIKR